MSTPVSRSAQPKASRGMPGITRRLWGNQATKEDNVRSCDDPAKQVVSRRAGLAVPAMLVGIGVGLTGYNALTSQPAVADTGEITKVFRWDSAPKCYIYGDVRTCGHLGGLGVTTVTLRGKPNSSEFLVTFDGEFQPQAHSGMTGKEKIYIVPKSREAFDNDVFLGIAHRGPDNFYVATTKTANSKFTLNDITDVAIRIDD